MYGQNTFANGKMSQSTFYIAKCTVVAPSSTPESKRAGVSAKEGHHRMEYHWSSGPIQKGLVLDAPNRHKDAIYLYR